MLAMPSKLVVAESYSLCDIVNDYRAVRISVVHWCQGLVPFLPSSIPYLKFNSRCLIK